MLGGFASFRQPSHFIIGMYGLATHGGRDTDYKSTFRKGKLSIQYSTNYFPFY